jgi:hypothetical protein
MEHVTRPREGGLSRLSHDDLIDGRDHSRETIDGYNFNLKQLATRRLPTEGSRPRFSEPRT